MSGVSIEKIKENVAEEISEAMESINGPNVSPENVEIICEDGEMTAKVSFHVNIVEEENYGGLLYW